MVKKWVKILAIISIIAIVGSAVVTNIRSGQPAGTIEISIDLKDGLWKQVEAMKADDSLVVGTLFLPDPAVIQVVSDPDGETHHLQIKNLETDKTLVSVPVTQENIDTVLNAITNAAERFKNQAGSAGETGQDPELYSSIQQAVGLFTK